MRSICKHRVSEIPALDAPGFLFLLVVAGSYSLPKVQSWRSLSESLLSWTAPTASGIA